MATVRAEGTKITFVRLNHDLTAIVIDYIGKTQKAWSLIEGKWIEADVVEALHEGGIEWGVKLEDVPPLPA